MTCANDCMTTMRNMTINDFLFMVAVALFILFI